MKRQTKLTTEQQQQNAGHQTHQPGGQEFSTAEEVLRFDAAHTVVPTDIGQRLQKSSAGLSQPKPAWWKRFLGGTNS